MVLLSSAVGLLLSCGAPDTYTPVDYGTLSQNAGQYYADKEKIELRGQVMDLVQSDDYSEIGDPAGPNAEVAFTIESFLLNVGAPLSATDLDKVHRAYVSSGTYGGSVLKDKGRDLDLVLVRWAAPPDIPQRAKPGSDPYPVTPGSTVTVQGVLTTGSAESWKHCPSYLDQYGDHPCTNVPDASGLRMEATSVDGVESARFGAADGPMEK